MRASCCIKPATLRNWMHIVCSIFHYNERDNILAIKSMLSSKLVGLDLCWSSCGENFSLLQSEAEEQK